MGRLQRYRDWKQYTRYYTRRFAQLQKNKAQCKMKVSRVPQLLRDKFGIEAVDPLSPDFPKPKVKQEFKMDHPAYKQNVPDEEHPLYKTDPCLLYDGSKPFAEGLKQALVLTKSLPRYGLPEVLLKKVERVKLNVEKNRILNLIMQSQAWDSTLEELPCRRDKDVWWIKHPPYYGIPQLRKNDVLLDNFFRFSLMLSDQYDALSKLRHFKNGDINVLTERNEKLIRLAYSPRITVLAPDPISPLETDQSVSSTKDEPVVDIYPVGPTIDLKQQNIYDDRRTYPLMWSSSPLVPRTVMLSKDFDLNYPWTPTETVANLMMACFGLAVSYAQKKYTAPGSRIFKQILPQPVTIQGVQVCRGVFDFVIFQLNTLDLSNDDGVKNLFWIDKDNQMFSTPHFYETFKMVNDYDPRVTQKLLALMLNSIS